MIGKVVKEITEVQIVIPTLKGFHAALHMISSMYRKCYGLV